MKWRRTTGSNKKLEANVLAQEIPLSRLSQIFRCFPEFIYSPNTDLYIYTYTIMYIQTDLVFTSSFHCAHEFYYSIFSPISSCCCSSGRPNTRYIQFMSFRQRRRIVLCTVMQLITTKSIRCICITAFRIFKIWLRVCWCLCSKCDKLFAGIAETSRKRTTQ